MPWRPRCAPHCVHQLRVGELDRQRAHAVPGGGRDRVLWLKARKVASEASKTDGMRQGADIAPCQLCGCSYGRGADSDCCRPSSGNRLVDDELGRRSYVEDREDQKEARFLNESSPEYIVPPVRQTRHRATGMGRWTAGRDFDGRYILGR